MSDKPKITVLGSSIGTLAMQRRAGAMRDMIMRAAEQQGREMQIAIDGVAEKFRIEYGHWPLWVVSETWVDGLAMKSEVWATDDEQPTTDGGDRKCYRCIAYGFGRFNYGVAEA